MSHWFIYCFRCWVCIWHRTALIHLCQLTLICLETLLFLYLPALNYWKTSVYGPLAAMFHQSYKMILFTGWHKSYTIVLIFHQYFKQILSAVSLLKSPPSTIGGLGQNLTRDALKVDVSTCSLRQFYKNQINIGSLTNGYTSCGMLYDRLLLR